MVNKLQWIEAEQLAPLILNKKDNKLMVVDVRDEDYSVGNVKSSINIPSIEFDDQLDDLIEQCIIDELDTIVFHCHFSQMRGPSAALKFQEAFSKKHPDKDHLQVQVLTGGWKYWYARYRNHENRDQLIELH